MVVNAAFLVDRAKTKEFDAAAEAASYDRQARMQFRLLGPHPPHAFVGSAAWA